MAQREIFEYLSALRNNGDDKYYTVKDIRSAMGNIFSVRTMYNGIFELSKSRHIEYDHESAVMNLLNNRPIMKKYRAQCTTKKSI